MNRTLTIYAALSAALLTVGASGAATRGAEAGGTQTAHSFKKQIVRTVSANYLLYLPKEYGQDSARKWPLILFLHGAGERGNDVEIVKRHGPPLALSQGKELPFIVVSPQCPEGQFWSNDVLIALLDQIERSYSVDPDRIYLTGLSMGGFGTWDLAEQYPDKFAAIAPMSSGSDVRRVRRLRNVPVWVFHGAKDPVVPIKGDQDAVDALKQAGGDVKFTIVPDGQHDIWDPFYSGSELYDWFLQHTRAKTTK